MTIGIDRGDVWSHYCKLNEDGEVLDRGRFRITAKAIEKWFTDIPPARVAMETSTHSIWISAQLQELGHDVIVANVRELRAISHSDRKSEVSGDPSPAEGTWRGSHYGSDLRADARQQGALQAAPRVGYYLGLRAQRSQSGDRDPQLGITKAGNGYLRSLLIECSNHILRPYGRDSSLRQWGLHLAARGGKQSKSKAVVAVARKLAVLRHRLWSTQEPYIPLYEQAA